MKRNILFFFIISFFALSCNNEREDDLFVDNMEEINIPDIVEAIKPPAYPGGVDPIGPCGTKPENLISSYTVVTQQPITLSASGSKVEWSYPTVGCSYTISGNKAIFKFGHTGTFKVRATSYSKYSNTIYCPIYYYTYEIKVIEPSRE